MGNKKSLFILLLIFITLIIAISSVSAADLDGPDELTSDNHDEIVLEEQTNDLNLEESNDNLLKMDNDEEKLLANEGTFGDLNDTINNNSDTEIYLYCDYDYYSKEDTNFTSGILINRSLTIYGNGHKISGLFFTRAFQVNASNVIFKDIVFSTCGKWDTSPLFNGGAINVLGSNCNVSAINCTFERCQGYNGAATYNCTAINCTFNQCDAYYSGGAMYYGEAINCSFTGNKAKMGGALYGTNAANCNFTSNEARDWEGGAILWGNAINCTFKNNKANLDGGAVFEGDAENCVFENNQGYYGGAITYAKLKNCTFINNKAIQGGAAYYCNAINCTFKNNHAKSGGATYYGSSINCTFTSNYGYMESQYTSSSYTQGGAMYGGTATNCTFASNYAHSGGAMYYGTAINCNFTENSATGQYTANGWGGAGYSGTYENCLFQSNKATRRGGALYAGYAVNCTFSGNTVPTYEGTGTYKGTSVLCRYLGGNSYYSTTIPTDLIKTGSPIVVEYPSEIELQYKLEYNGREFKGYDMAISIYKDSGYVTYYNVSGSTLKLNLSVGTYRAYFALVDFGNAYSKNLNIQVKGTPITFTANKLNITCLEEGYIIGTLTETNTGIPLVGYNITLNQWSTLKNISQTDSNGQVKFPISGLNEGYYYFTLVFDGDKQYDKKTISCDVTIRKVSPIISALDIDILYGQTTNLVVKLGDELNNNLSGRNLSVEFNGGEFDLITNATSEISLPIPILSPENYTVSISFKGNSTYYDASKKVNINVYQIRTQIESSNVRAIFNEGKVIATLKAISGEALENYTLFIYVGDKTYNGTTDADGQIEVDLLDLDEGNYTATIRYIGRELYANSTTNIEVWIGKFITNLFGENATFIYREGGFLIVNLTDEFDHSMVNRTINILDSNNLNTNLTTDNNGQIKFEIDRDSNVPGDYWVDFSYGGDERYLDSNVRLAYYITRIPTQIISANVSMFYNEEKGINATLIDKYGNPLNGERVVVRIFTSTLSDLTDGKGQTYFSAKGLPAKNLTATIDFGGNEFYENSQATVEVMINKASAIATDVNIVPSLITTFNSSKMLVITLTDSSGPIAGAILLTSLGGTDYTNTTNGSGQVEIPVDLAPDTYVLTVIFPGDGEHNGISLTTNITVNKANPMIVAGDKIFRVNVESKPYNFTLKDNKNNALKDCDVTINVDGTDYYGKTNDEGIAFFDFDKLNNAGKFNALITYGGNGNFNSATKNVTITVNKADSRIVAGNKTFKANVNNKMYNITLKDNMNKPLKNCDVALEVGGVIYHAKTDDDGVAVFKIDKLNNVATYDAVITFAGNNNFNSVSKNVKISVKKATSKIVASNKAFNVNVKTKEFKITLKDDLNNPIKNAKVAIKVNGKVYYANTDSKGVATFKIASLTKTGNFNAEITFAGNSKYNSASKKVTLTVKKAASKIVASNKAFKVNVKTKEFKITLKDDLNNPIKNTKVVIKVNGKVYYANTNSKGVATFKITKLNKVGNFNTLIKFVGNSNYKSSSKNVVISVKR